MSRVASAFFNICADCAATKSRVRFPASACSATSWPTPACDFNPDTSFFRLSLSAADVCETASEAPPAAKIKERAAVIMASLALLVMAQERKGMPPRKPACPIHVCSLSSPP